MNFSSVLEVAASLATSNRYSKSRLNNPESVLEHSGFVTLISYFIGNAINKYRSIDPIDMGALLSKAIVHDIDEHITGDVQRPTKYSTSEMSQLFKELSYNAAKTISEQTEIKTVLKDWDHSKKGITGAIVAFADTAAVVFKAYDEVYMRGNKTIEFGTSIGLKKLIRKRINNLELFQVPNEIIESLSSSCYSMLYKIEEVLK